MIEVAGPAGRWMVASAAGGWMLVLLLLLLLDSAGEAAERSVAFVGSLAAVGPVGSAPAAAGASPE